MAKYKVGDTVEVTRSGGTYSEYINKFWELGFKNKSKNRCFSNGTKAKVFGVTTHDVIRDRTLYAIRTADGLESLIQENAIKLIKSNDMSELKITKEKVLAAAAKCSTAKATLKTLFPEAFEGIGKISIDMQLEAFRIDGYRAITIEDGSFGVKGKEFHLESEFNWELKKCELGYRLIPTYK